MTTIAGLVHRCITWAPTGSPPDAYGQPAPAGFAQTATAVPCRLEGAEEATPTLYFLPTTTLDPGDRVTAITRAGQGIDPGPFAVLSVEDVPAHATVTYRRATLRRLTSIDQS